MKRYAAAILLLLTPFAYGNSLCRTAALPRALPQIELPEPPHALSLRLEALFAGKGHVTDHSPDDFRAATEVIKRVVDSGNQADLDLIGAYLSIKESSLAPTRALGGYRDPYAGVRPQSLIFQDAHWDWKNLGNYFSATTAPLGHLKSEDLRYLEHVAKVARTGAKIPLDRLLEEARYTWDLKELRHFPKIAEALADYRAHRTYAELYTRALRKFQSWQPRAMADHRERDVQEGAYVFALLRQSTSIFDLFLFESYFDLLARHAPVGGLTYSDGRQGHIDPDARVHDPRGYPGDGMPYPVWLQLQDFRVFEMGLSSGSLAYLGDFLFQNSHDSAMKGYLGEILLTLQNKPARRAKEKPSFFWEFQDAVFALMSDESRQLPAPEIYQSDMHLITTLHKGSRTASLAHIKLAWSPSLKKLHGNIEEAFPLDQNSTAQVLASPNLRAWVKRYFDNFRTNSVYSTDEVDHDEQAELDSFIRDSTFIVFTKPGRDQLLSMIRILDASHRQTYIEHELPQVEIPERLKNVPIFELGRLLSVAEVEANSLPTILASVADYYKNANLHGMVYLDGNRAAMVYYKRKQAEVVYTPEQLKLPEEATPLWVMKAHTGLIVTQFSTPSYEAVRLRRIP